MRLHLLGVNGPFPEPDQCCSGYLVEAGSTLIQMDLGTGILSRLTRLVPPEGIEGILLSHWHFDHCSDMLPLIYRLEALHQKLCVFAPADDHSPIRRVVASASCFELRDVHPGDTFSLGSATITVGPAVHPVPAVMYRIEDSQKVLWYTGDTNYYDGIADFCLHADLLLADGLFPEQQWSPEKPHLSALKASQLAKDTAAAQFVLTHLNPLIPQKPLLEEARSVFPRVVLARPGLTLEI